MKCKRDRCSRAAHRRGLCHQHYRRYLNTQPTGMAPIGPVREHLKSLIGAGMTHDQIALVAGVSRRSTIQAALYELNRESMRASTAARVLSVEVPKFVANRPAGYVPTIGVTRRLRALMATGYLIKDLAEHSGITAQQVSLLLSGRQERTRAGTARAVDEMFRKLQLVPSTNARAIRRAERCGWYPPFAWDEEEIDDPQARPRCSKRVSGEWFGQYEMLKAQGLSDAGVAARIGINPASLSRRLKRHRERLAA